MELSPLRPQQSGVFRAPRFPQTLAALRKEAQRTRCAWISVDLHGVGDEAGMLEACARQLRFPRRYARNWNAFSDAVNDLSWQGAPGFVLELENVDGPAQHAPQALEAALEILRAAAEAWCARNTTFVVLLDYAPPRLAVEPFPEPPLD